MAVIFTFEVSRTAQPSNATVPTATWHHVEPRNYPEGRGIGEMVWDEARGEANYSAAKASTLF